MASADLLDPALRRRRPLRRAAVGRRAGAKLLPVVERVTPEIEAMAGGAASELSRGGMRTKIEAARIATSAGTHMVIADGRVAHPIARVAEGGRCTWFLTPSNPVAARKIWIGGSLELKGAVFVDAGAAAALAGGKSLLPAGVTRSRGRRSRAAIASRSATSAAPRSAAASSPTTRCTPSGSAAATRATSPISSERRARRDDPPRRHGAGRAVTARPWLWPPPAHKAAHVCQASPTAQPAGR